MFTARLQELQELPAAAIREPPSPNPPSVPYTPTGIQQGFLHGAWLSLTQEQGNTFIHASHSLTRVHSPAELHYRLCAH